MKKVLLISYSFPPSPGPESTLMADYVKYLPYFEWTPVVLTSMDNSIFQRNFSKKQSDNKIRVINTLCLEDFFIKAIKILYSSLNSNSEKNKLGDNHKTKIIQKVRYFRIFPYWRLFWTPFIIISGIRAINTEKIDMIYSRSGAINSHIAALIIKYFFKIPWVISFSDPWINDPNRLNRNKILPAIIPEYFEKHIECILLNNADKIILTTNSQKEDFLARYSLKIAEKISIIPNSFDFNENMHNNNLLNIHQPLIASYAGTFSDTRTPEPLFIALNQLNKEINLNNKIRVRFIGGLGKYKELILKYDLKEIVEEIDFVDREKIINYYYQSDILLLIDSETHFMCLPTKLVEYIFIGKPIFAISSDKGESENLITRTKTGFCVSPRNIFEIQMLLKKIINSDNHIDIHPDWSEINKYSARNCSKQLAEIMMKINI